MRFDLAISPHPSSNSPQTPNSLQWAYPAPTVSSSSTSSPPATSADPATSEFTATTTPAAITSSTEDPERQFRRAAEPALVRIRQDCRRASDRVSPLLAHLEQHLFHPDLNVNQLKRACGARDNSIVILFHAEIGQPPKAYITGRRLETAARLLRETTLKIWQISDLVGYSALGVFSKAFDRWAGLRPLFYRQQVSAHSSGRTPAPPEIFDGEFLDRAMTARLTEDESSRLIARLCEIYDLRPPAFEPT